MKLLRSNKSLTYSVLETYCTNTNITLYVHPFLLKVAKEIFGTYVTKFEFKENDKIIDLMTAIEKGYVKAKVELFPRTDRTMSNNTEWLLITDKEMYYSKGTT